MSEEVVLLEAEQVTESGAIASSDVVDRLIAAYQYDRARIDQVVEMTSSEVFTSVAHHFYEGNANEDRGRVTLSGAAAQLFERAGAVAHLKACYWQQAMALTDVYDAMPQKRRDEWNAMIRHPLGTKKHRDAKEFETQPIPEFEEQTVRSTLQGLLLSRSTFFAERVDGIFQALSRTHVTNCPEGFNRRMILTGITSMYGGTDRVGYINDLRVVVAKFMGRDEPKWHASSGIVATAKHQRGQWLAVDGGAIRIRCYLNGNAHLEVHPDIAWRLNVVLAQLHPAAIPSQFRAKPKKVSKEWQVLKRPLPFAVIECLSALEQANEFIPTEPSYANGWSKHCRRNIKNAVQFRFGYGQDTGGLAEAKQVLEGLGGVQVSNKSGTYWQFDYEPTDVLNEVRASGCLPDQKSHQFYATQERMAKRVEEFAMDGATPSTNWLEPSAGTGGLANFMPKDRTLCVEISELHCKVLAAKGFLVSRADFLSMPVDTKFDRVVMNPPFSDGRWQAHVQHAAAMVAPSGRLVAILPSGARSRLQLDGFNLAWHGPYSNEFPGVSVDVVILVADLAEDQAAA